MDDQQYTLEPIDYDPFATPAASPEGAIPEPGEDKKPIVIPKVELPEVTFEADAPKPEPTKPQEYTLEPIDYDPFKQETPAAEKGTFVVEAPKAVAAGATEYGGTVLQGMGGQRQLDMFERRRGEARAKVLAQFGLTSGLSHRGIITPSELEAMPIARQQAFLEELQKANDSVEPPDVTQDPFYKAGLATENWSKENFKAARDYENSWTRNIGTALGTTIPGLAAGMTGPLGVVIGLEMSAAGGIGETIDNAIKKGATREQIAQAMQYGAIPGLTDQVAIEGLLAKIPVPAMGKVLTALGKVATKAMIEGGQEAAQQAMQNAIAKYVYDPKQDIMEGVLKSAGYGAIVGGIVAGVEPDTYHAKAVKTEEPAKESELPPGPQEEPAKVDETPGVAAPAQEEGTPASTESMPDTSTPGGDAAKPAPQPAGTTKKGPVEEVTPNAPPADVAAAVAGTPISDTPATPVGPAEQPENVFNLRDELPEDTSEEVVSKAESEQQARLKAMFAGANLEETTVEAVEAKQREKQAAKTVVAPANADVSAALQSEQQAPKINPPEPAIPPVDTTAGQPAMGTEANPVNVRVQETLGTKANQFAQEPPAANITPASAPPNPQLAAPAAAGPTASARAPIAPTSTGAIQPQQAAPVTPVPPVTLPKEDVAAFNVEPVTPAVAPGADKAKAVSRKKATVAPTEAPAVAAPTVAEIIKPAPEKAAAAKAVSKKKELPPRRKHEHYRKYDPKNDHPVLKEMNDLKDWLNTLSDEDYQAISEDYGGPDAIDRDIQNRNDMEAVKQGFEATIKRSREKKAEAKPTEAKKPEEKVSEPAAPRERKPLTITRKEAPKAEAAKIVSKKRAEKVIEPVSHHQMKTEVEATAKTGRAPLARDIHNEARDKLRRELPDTSEGDLHELITEESDLAAAEADKELSPRERIEAGTARVVENVKRRVAEKEKAERDAYQSEEDKAAAQASEDALEREREQEAEKKKRENQAKEESGQKKERRGRNKGMSSHGRKVQSHKSLMREFADESAKPESEQNKLVMEYGREHQKQARAKQADKASHEAEKERIKEELIKQAEQEEADAATEELSKEHAEARDKVQSAMDAVPMPKDIGDMKPLEQAKTLRQHLADFRKAIAGIKLPPKVNRAYQSVQESLAIFAKRPSTDPGQFAAARYFAEEIIDGNDSYMPEFYATVMTEDTRGSMHVEGGGEKVDTEQDERYMTEDETKLGSGVRQQEADTAETLSAWNDAQALIKNAKESPADQRAQEKAAAQEPRRVTVTRPDGTNVEITASTQKGSAVLRDLAATTEDGSGFVSVIRNALIRHLTMMVGDVNVHFVSSEDMAKLHDQQGTAGGLYYNYSPKQRADGMKPMIFIDESLQFEHMFGQSAEYSHTLIHEFTHAATSLALELDLHGTRAVIRSLMRNIKANMTAAELAEFHYAFTNEAEFIAEAFSNEDFQYYLAEKKIPPELARQISGVSPVRLPTWMNAVAAAVSNALGMRWGQRGQTYMEHILKLYPALSSSSIRQETLAKNEVKRLKSSTAMPTGPAAMEPQALMRRFDDLLDATRSAYTNNFTAKGRNIFDKLSTGGTQILRSHELFGGYGNPMQRLIETHLGSQKIYADYRKSPGAGVDNAALEKAQHDLKKKDPKLFRELSRLLHEMSRYGIDATVGLSHQNNAHINKTGPKHQQVRAMHAKLEAEWNALPANAKAVGQQTIDHYRAAGDAESRSIITNALENAQRKYNTSLPAGKTMDDAVDWFMSGDAQRTGANMTQTDKDWHKALGKTARTIADVPMLRSVEGVYVPFMRRGKFFLSARERIFGTLNDQRNIPKGAVLDAVTDKEKLAPNRLLFKDEADFNDFMDNHDTQARGTTMYVNPLTGAKTTRDAMIAHPTKPGVLVVPQRIFVATVQNHRVEMADNKTYLRNRAKELADNGHHVGSIGLAEKSLHQVMRETAPAEIARLIRNLEQTTLGQHTIGQEALANSVYDAYIRQRTSPGSLARGLKRRGTLGEDLDLLQSTVDYNRDLARTLTNNKISGKLTDYDNAVKKYIREQQALDSTDSDMTIKRQALYDEVASRITGFKGESNKGKLNRTSNFIRNIVNFKQLMSPHFSIMQLVQPGQTTLPILAGRHGTPAAVAEMEKAYRIGGRAKTVLSGLGRTIKATKQVFGEQDHFDNDAYWKHEMSKEKDGAELADVADRVVELGYGASSGIEAPHISRLDMNKLERGVDNISNIAMALPESIEAMNRYVSATAAYRLARKSGMPHEEAVDHAVLVVEQSQGGYGAANNPTFFQNPLLGAALQFRKYSVSYANLFYRNLSWMFSGDPVRRKIAAKTLVGLALTTVALAGTTGLPLVEPLRILVMTAHLLGAEDDWDDWENGTQKWLSKMMEWATGSKTLADALAEANMYGYTRLANIDTHNMFGNDSLLAFGEPKTADSEGIFGWLGKMATGATGSMFADALKNYQNGDYLGAVPWPKVIKNLMDAYKIRSKGTVDPKTGKQYHEPFSNYEAFIKALGLRPAEESRAFEAGGSATTSKELKQMSAARRSLMEKWRNLSGYDRSDFFSTKIREWNQSHRNPDEKIQMQDLLRSVRSAKGYEKRMKKMEQYAD